MLQLHLSDQQFLLPTKVRLILETLRYFVGVSTGSDFDQTPRRFSVDVDTMWILLHRT